LEPGRVVTLSDEGRVVDISSPEHLDRQAGVEFFPGILVPGFLNAHCHLELSHLRGAIAPGGGFAGFARGMREARVGFSDEQRFAAAGFWDARMWSEGVAAVNDVCNGPSTFEMKTRSRIGYRNFCELFGLDGDPAHVFALRDRARELGLWAGVTPHSLYSLNRAAFDAAIDNDNDNGDRDRPLSLHFMESEDEIDLFKKRGLMWEWYREQGVVPDFLDFEGPAERLVARVAPDRAVMLVHNTCVTQREIDMVMGHFTAPVTWVLCPGSNSYISGLEPPVDLLRRNGVRIAIGTDSLASNHTLSMVREMWLLDRAARRSGGVPLAELLSWAAADTIEVGHTPGLILLSGVEMKTLSLTENSRAERIV
jgi:cytosine/adenosine deaminase-related metal-dependent hydrolase